MDRQWIFDALVAYLSGAFSWLLVGFFDWLPAYVRFRERRAEARGELKKAHEVDATFPEATDAAIDEMLKNQADREPDKLLSAWATCMQALLTLMIIAPALFWFKDGLRASWALKAYVALFIFVFVSMVIHELQWKQKPTTGRIAWVTGLWLLSLASIMGFASASAERKAPVSGGEDGGAQNVNEAQTSAPDAATRDALANGASPARSADY